MWNLSNGIFFVGLILGVVILFLLNRWNGKKLSSKQKELLESDNSSTRLVFWISLICGTGIPATLQIQRALGYEHFG